MDGIKYSTLQCRGPLGKLEKDVGVLLTHTPQGGTLISCPYYKKEGPQHCKGEDNNRSYENCVFGTSQKL